MTENADNLETLNLLLDVAGNPEGAGAELRIIAWALAGALADNLDEQPTVVSNRNEHKVIKVKINGQELKVSRIGSSISAHSLSGGLEESFSGESRIKDFIEAFRHN